MNKKEINLNVIYLILISFAIVLVSGLGLFVYLRNYVPFENLRVRIDNGRYREDIKLWSDEEISYIFLPTYADMDSTYLVSDYQIFLNGKQMNVDDNLSDIEFGVEYTLREKDVLRDNEIQVIFMKSSNIGTIFIDTETGGIEKLYEDKEYSEKAYMTVFTENGEVEYHDDLDFISGRGNQTWNYDKRPWTIKTKKDVSLLGMEKDSKWVLIANMCEDTDGLRNMAAYTMAEEIGMNYASELQFVDLYMNGIYFGTYQLGEKIEVSKNRMDIGDLSKENKKVNEDDYDLLAKYSVIHENEDGSFFDYTDIESPEDISGGYVVERNYGTKWEVKTYRFRTTGDEKFNVREPNALSEKEGEFLLNTFQTIENALFAEDYTDPVSGKEISELIDIDSWVLKYMVDEATKNQGGGATSSYFYIKNGDPKVYAGPAWDYDKSFGISKIWKYTEGLTYCCWHHVDDTLWFRRLYDYKPFYDKVVECYKSKVKPYYDNLVNNQIDAWKEEIRSSYEMNYIRWRNAYGFNGAVDIRDLRNHGGDIDYATSYMKEWISGREDFLDSVWLDGEIYYSAIFTDYKVASYVGLIVVKPGEKLGELPEYEYNDGKYVWINQSNGEIATEDTIITSDTKIIPKAVNN